MFVGNKRRDGHLDRLLRLEKSTSVHKKAGKGATFFLLVYLPRYTPFYNYFTFREPVQTVLLWDNKSFTTSLFTTTTKYL